MATTPRSEMRILTVRQPWAWAIIHGGKDVENRVRNIAGGYRGPVAIHVAHAWGGDSLYSMTLRSAALREAIKATGAMDDVEAFSALEIDLMDNQRGAIIGVVDLVGAHNPTEPIFGLTGCHGECTPWSEMGQWHLRLANPRALAEPIPYRGALGLRRLDEDTTARILAQIGESA